MNQQQTSEIVGEGSHQAKRVAEDDRCHSVPEYSGMMLVDFMAR
jgi:hypothetical protein